jgi:predicted ATPase
LAAGFTRVRRAVVERGGGLLGREAVLGVAEAALDEMLSGAGQLLLVTGEPGIGKSAVFTEVARRGSHRGARVLRGCHRLPSISAYSW